MDIIQQNRSLMRLVWVLVLINVGVVAVVLWKSGQSAVPSAPVQSQVKPAAAEESVQLTDVLQSELELSKEQCRQIDELRARYRVKERELAARIREERDSMNTSMFDAQTNDALVRALARRVAENEFAMELMRYQQAQDFKAICTPAQQEKFERLIKEIRDYFRPNQRRGREADGRDDNQKKRRRDEGANRQEKRPE